MKLRKKKKLDVKGKNYFQIEKRNKLRLKYLN